MNSRSAKMHLIFSDARGVYIPRDFAREMKRDCVANVTHENWEVLEAGPEHEWYWETWNDVEQRAVVTAPEDGCEYTIYQDGDCWLVEKGAEYNERPDDTGIDDMFIVEIEE